MIISEIKEKIHDWAAQKLKQLDLFIVDIKVSGLKIQIFLDHEEKSVHISDCTQMSRHIESFLDADVHVPEKYVLEVSSAGAEHSLRLPKQYKKRIGKEVAITKTNGVKLVGTLTFADEEQIHLNVSVSLKPNKKKVQEKKKHSIPYSEIKKSIIQFKL